MPRSRIAFIASLLVAALVGFCAGLMVGTRGDTSIGGRTHRAVSHVKDAFHDLVR
ncbi:MAG TPA: DUF1049 domain-containing protein [Anaeromyxobacter sp.]|nr:DUF1049 domain-containing protein [Anaeromyxobacter sp.]